MYSYWVYSLIITSTIEIPNLKPLQIDLLEDQMGDVQIVYQDQVADFDQYDRISEIYIELNEDQAVMFDRRYALFILNHGKEVIIQPSAARNLDQICLYILGTVLTVLLYQRGTLALHGSAVAIGNAVIGVIAPSGTGKSSTAAALYDRGHRLLSDDAVPIVFQDGQFYVYPGYPRMKISEPVAECLGFAESQIVQRHPDCGELSFDARSQFVQQPLLLQQIYVLEAGEEIGIQPLSAKDALFAMMPNSLPTMWHKPHTPAQLAQKIPFYKMTRSQNLSDLPYFAACLEEHALNSMKTQ
jgi:hypothetical protein